MINLTYAECRVHGRTLFGKRPRRRLMTCMICDRPASAYEAEIHIRRCNRQPSNTALDVGTGPAVVGPLPNKGNG